MRKAILVWSIFMVFLLLATPLYALTNNQISIINQCKRIGEPYDLGKTMAAICYHESRGGKYKINLDTGDFGVAHINLKTAVTRLGLKNTWVNRNTIATRLVEEDELSMHLALEELLYWRDIRKRSWKDAVASYNQGTIIDSYRYYKAIVKEIRYLEKLGILEESK